jgi:hypothetical protein
MGKKEDYRKEYPMQDYVPYLTRSLQYASDLTSDSLEPGTHEYEEATHALVEPEMPEDMSEEYHSFIEQNPKGWAEYITVKFGGLWGKLAYIVAEEGY